MELINAMAIGASGMKAQSTRLRVVAENMANADPDGYVRMPNVDVMVEMMDMREAQRSYEANLNVIDAARNMLSRAIDLLHG